MAAHAESVWVADDMMRLIGQAAQTLPASTELAESDVPFRAGLAVLEKVYTDQGYYGSKMYLAGLSWTLHSADGQYGFLCGLYAYARVTPGAWPRLILVRPDVFVPLGRSVGSADERDGDNRFARLCATFLLLLGQPLSEWEQQEPPRQMQRQAEHTGHKIRTIRTVALRRPQSDSGNGERYHRDWSHRWMVSAHWRRQWYASEQRHRSILIGPYVKGPDCKPLVLKQRAFRWVR